MIDSSISRYTIDSVRPFLVLGANEYFPWLATRLQFCTDFGICISTTTSSSILPIDCFGPTVSSSRPAAPLLSTTLWRIDSGIGTRLKERGILHFVNQ